MKNFFIKHSACKSVLFLFFYLIGTTAFGQNNGSISGKIKDANGNPVNGASIQIKGTKKGTTSNAEGVFSIMGVQEGKYILEITSLGLEKQEVNVVVSKANSPAVDIIMKVESKSLGEVVVVAYGTSTKKTTTGAIQTINTKDLQDLPVAQFTQKLQGKLAGVQISQTTGKPGQGMSVKIRGQASILAGSDPLYVVDGFPITGDISNINPDEIESVTVLKDAASTSLYGSRAANGVVLITTFHANSGQSSVSANAYYGTQTVPQKGRPDMMNATEFAQFKKESYEDLGVAVPTQFQNPSQYGGGYNWYDAMLQTAPIQNYSASFTSNRDKFSTSVVAGYFNQDGVLRNSNYQRYSLRANTEFKVNEKIKAGFNVAPSYSINNTPGSDGAFYATNINSAIPGGLLYNSLLTWPILPYKNADGTLPLTAWIPGISAFPTPNWYRALQEIKNKTNTTRILSNAYVEYQPITGVTLKSSINIDMGNSLFNNFNPSTSSSVFTALPPVTASAINNNSNYYSWLNENTATYKKSFNDHNFDILLGYTTQKFRSDMNQVASSNYPDNRISTIQSAININRTQSFTDIQEWSLISYIGRLNYNYKGKYLFTAALRRDGSSRFGANNQWGNFPSISAGWLVSDENFMTNIKAISFLKIRGSYGTVGNNNIGNYTQYATVNNTTNAVFGSTVASGASVTTLGNANLGWETTKQFDLGADLSLFNGRINFTYDFYTKRTTSLLYNLAVPQESGFTNYTGNIGELKFWGHEFALDTKNTVGAFKWNTDFNISFSDNKVMALSGGVDYIFGGFGAYQTITKVGQRIGQFWGVIQEGVYKDQADFDKSPKAIASEVGTAKFKDVNGDGKITYGGAPGKDDRTNIGNPFPKFLFGITNNFSYKNFDLSIVGSGSVGNDVLVLTDQATTNLDGVFNVLKELKDRWRSPLNPGAGKYGKTTSGTGNERDWLSSRFVSHADFFTIKNIALGYNLPLKKNILFRSVRLYASVQQAFVFTKYRGANPEVSTTAQGQSGSALNMGMDWGTYPIPRTITFGVNFSLK
jgi:TonB-linked SusC/RagA family outer membrane protein